MSKQPVPGQVKTRLAAAVGESTAAEFYEAFLKDTLITARALSGTDLLISFTPARARDYYLELAPGARLITQPDGDLGRRLCHAFETAFSLGYERAVIAGSDSPQLTAACLEEAFASTRKGTAVIGPAEDGGYYLLGLTGPAPALFEDIDWGSEHVFVQTERQAHVAGLRLQVLPPEFDVDTIEDLHKLDVLLRDSNPDRCAYTRSRLMRVTLAEAASP